MLFRSDKVVGLPIVYFLNILARILGFFLRIDHSLTKSVKTIVVCKFVGMGSIVQSTPLLKTLRKKYPNTKIIFVTNKTNVSLFHFIDEVDDVFYVSDKGILSLISSSKTHGRDHTAVIRINFQIYIYIWSVLPKLQ